MISWSRKQIALKQLAFQRKAITDVLTQLELSLRPESGSHAWRAREEIQRQLRLLEEARRQTEALPCRSHRLFLSDFVVRIYDWATENRLKMD